MKKQVEIGALLLRVALGLLFFVHGLDKFQGGIGNTAGWFQSIGLPGFAAYLVAFIELVGGIALVVGLGTRIVSGLFVLIMLGAIIKVKFAAGFLGGFELDLALMVMALYLVINGSMMLSVDSKLPVAKRGV
ncbi:DoxX family protein [Paenibacillus prosopidis]|uniref:Putative membrane protein YphA (DoxX/SURF4 family) n=1 Tax=Paenibacillus prosopidis TaxID=630520 RepID=A0A368W4P0_9BACL|nr:DoxX family protein [Paenibacillus prosopidis]RCW50401.1 putative membrane protein YphA (DoxX/SURF4 family) [Paenibacillus prosopidis]